MYARCASAAAWEQPGCSRLPDVKALVCHEIGNFETIAIGELPEPHAGPGELVLSMDAAAVTRRRPHCPQQAKATMGTDALLHCNHAENLRTYTGRCERLPNV